MEIPPLPTNGPRAKAPVPLRFEDVTQDGRLVLEALPNALAPTLWRGILSASAGAQALREEGIVPILTRLRVEGTAGPFSADASVEAEASYRWARAPDGRFILEMWADLYAPLGRTYASTERAGQRALAGRVLSEHVLTRPFAPPGERRVTSLSFAGAPQITETRDPSPQLESIASLPEGAAPLEPRMLADPVPVAFGLVHTDSNMHVNSLVYLRLFEEAGLRRFARLGRSFALLARSVDIAYRKPCFAGQMMAIALQAFEADGGPGVAAVLVAPEHACQFAGAEGGPTSPSHAASARPNAYVRMQFQP